MTENSLTPAVAPEIAPEAAPEDTFAEFAEFAALNKQRAATYGLLSRLFRVEIDEAFLAELRGMRFPAHTGSKNADEGYRLMATYLNNSWDNTLTDLAVDYLRVFIGHGVDGFSAAYPYESVYTSEKRLLMQAARDQVLAVYRSMDIVKQEGAKVCEDHVALELEFMQIIALRAVEALEAGDEDAAISLMNVQKTFLEEHLLMWVPMMTSDMRRFAKTDLYRGLAYLTDGFLAIDKAFLDDILAEDTEEE